VFTCVGRQKTLCDPMGQETFCSCVMGYVPLTAIFTFTFLHLTGSIDVKNVEIKIKNVTRIKKRL